MQPAIHQRAAPAIGTSRMAGGTFHAGAAARDVTPHSPVSLHGYGNRVHRSSHDVASSSTTTPDSEPITVSCLALDDGAGTRLLLVATDMIGIEGAATQELYRLMFKEVGIGFPNVLISCSHTHFAPGLHPAETEQEPADSLPEPGFVAEFRAKLVEAAREALRSMRPAVLESSRREVSGVSYNRRWRNPDGSCSMHLLYPTEEERQHGGSRGGQGVPISQQPVDGGLTILRFRATGAEDEEGEEQVGQLIGAICNFGCHPVTGGGSAADHYRVSADYAHYLRETVSSAWLCPVLFTLGAAGDAVPILRQGNSRQRIGTSLGLSAVLAERTFTTEVAPTLAATAVTLPARVNQEHEWRPAYTKDAKSGHTTFDVQPQLLRIGATPLVSLPFEVLSEFSLSMKARNPNAVLVSCAGGYQGYLPLLHEFDRGGYEVEARSSHLEPGTADRLLNIAMEWVGEGLVQNDARVVATAEARL